MVNLIKLGQICKKHREQMGLYQYNVADDIGYSKENISSFECGRNDSAIIFLWYLVNGLDLDSVKEMMRDESF